MRSLLTWCQEGGQYERQAEKVPLEPLELTGKEHSLKTMMHISYEDGKHEDEYTWITHVARLGHHRELHEDHSSDTCSHPNCFSQSSNDGHENEIKQHYAQHVQEDSNGSILVWYKKKRSHAHFCEGGRTNDGKCIFYCLSRGLEADAVKGIVTAKKPNDVF